MKKIVLLLLSICMITASADNRKMSLCIRQMTNHSASMHQAPSNQTVRAFVKLNATDGEQLLADNGCHAICHIGDIVIADIPVGRLNQLADRDEVVRIETHTGGRLSLDTTAIHTNVAPAYEGLDLPQAFTGEGVLLGISDIGFDLTHPTFYSADGERYRIKRVLDQFTHDPEPFGHATDLGVEYTTEEAILAKQHTADATTEMHGTHCLGIAAGSGYDKPYRGMAFGADICAVSSSTGDGERYSANEVAILKYIFDYADSIGRPCVITYSIGFDYVPGDAILYEEALQQLLGPGHILVAAAGNENESTKYFHKRRGVEAAGGSLSNGWFATSLSFHLFSHDDFTLKVIDFNDWTHRAVDSIAISNREMTDTVVTLRKRQLAFTRLDTTYTCEVLANAYDFPHYGLIIEGEDADVQATCNVYANLTNETSLDKRLNAVEAGHTVILPATLPDVVAVGAMNYRTSYKNLSGQTQRSMSGPWGHIATFSSQGPTIDYRIKPDVVTPGVSIISSLNSFYLMGGGSDVVAKSTFNDRTYRWVAASGTSMATPAAAGVVALWLQAKPDLTPAEVLDVIAHTSQHPDPAADYPNNTYGHGHIDAYRGLLYLLGLSGISDISQHQPSGVRFVLTGRRLTVEYVAMALQHTEPRLAVYDTSGRLVLATTGTSADLSALPAGVYAVQLTTGKAETTGSTLIRL